MTCGVCGDPYETPPGHLCWLIQKMHTQESLLAPEVDTFLEIGMEPEDARIPARIRQVDLSNF